MTITTLGPEGNAQTGEWKTLKETRREETRKYLIRVLTATKSLAEAASICGCSRGWLGSLRARYGLSQTLEVAPEKTAETEETGPLVTFEEMTKRVTRRYLVKALLETEGHVTKAAQLSGYQRAAFHRLFARCDLDQNCPVPVQAPWPFFTLDFSA